MEREVGYIKSVVADRGFGFIQQADGRETFFHANGLSPELVFSERLMELRVSFVLEQRRDGRDRAVDLRPVA